MLEQREVAIIELSLCLLQPGKGKASLSTLLSVGLTIWHFLRKTPKYAWKFINNLDFVAQKTKKKTNTLFQISFNEVKGEKNRAQRPVTSLTAF